jgi:hypothetical protein
VRHLVLCGNSNAVLNRRTIVASVHCELGFIVELIPQALCPWTAWREMVNPTHQLIFPRRNGPRFSLDRMLGDPTVDLDAGAMRKPPRRESNLDSLVVHPIV